MGYDSILTHNGCYVKKSIRFVTNTKQIEEIKQQIGIIKTTDTLDIENTDLFGDIVDRIIIQNNRLVDVYLNFLPFGYRIAYTLIKPNKFREFDVIIDSCEIIS